MTEGINKLVAERDALKKALKDAMIKPVEGREVVEVICRIARDNAGVDYDVIVVTRSSSSVYEAHEVWSTRVEFGQTDATVAGGSAFVHAGRDQERIAAEISAVVWGHR